MGSRATKRNSPIMIDNDPDNVPEGNQRRIEFLLVISQLPKISTNDLPALRKRFYDYTQTFYVKCRDVNNMPYPMEVYDYHKREAKSEANPKRENFVTRSEFDALATAFNELKNQMQSRPQKTVKEATNAKPALQQT